METGLSTKANYEICPTCGEHYKPDTAICPADGARLMRQMPDPMIGMLLPRHYRITSKLGRGAMSVVYKGVYEPLGQPVAVKLLKSHLVDDSNTFKRFQQEAKTAGALEHPNIVTVFDFGVTDQGVPYLVMELLQGESLAQNLRRNGPMPIQKALDLFKQVAQALDYTHQHGVVHRDVKPSNLLIVHDELGAEVVKIVDFGIAKLQAYEGNPNANLTATGEVFGTPLYVSPEQALGREIDERADIYSLGCVMYEALCGAPPFNGPTAFDVLRMQINDLPQPLSGRRGDCEIPVPLIHVVERAMEKHPADRYQSMHELLEDLRTAQSIIAGMAAASAANRSSRTSAPPTSPMPLNARTIGSSGNHPVVPQTVPISKHKLPWLLFAIAALAGMAVGILILFFSRHGAPAVAERLVKLASGGSAYTSHPLTPTVQKMDPQAKSHLDAAREAFDKENLAAAESECNKAIDLLQSAGPSPALAVALSDLCATETSLGKYTQAAKAGNKAVAMFDQSDPDQQLDLAIALQNLAQGLMTIDLGTSEQLYKRALELKTKVLGADDPQTADTLHAIGLLRQAKGDYAGAADYLKRAQQIRLAKLGENSAAVATSYRCAGALAFRQKKMNEAEQSLKHAAEIDKKVCGADSSAVAQDSTCLAMLYESEKKWDLAEKNYRQALKISEQVYGSDSPRLISRLRNLAHFLRARQKSTEAKSLERTARQISAGD